MARTMSVFCEGISVDIPSSSGKECEIGRRQGVFFDKEPADAENLVKYPG